MVVPFDFGESCVYRLGHGSDWFFKKEQFVFYMVMGGSLGGYDLPFFGDLFKLNLVILARKKETLHIELTINYRWQ